MNKTELVKLAFHLGRYAANADFKAMIKQAGLGDIISDGWEGLTNSVGSVTKGVKGVMQSGAKMLDRVIPGGNVPLSPTGGNMMGGQGSTITAPPTLASKPPPPPAAPPAPLPAPASKPPAPLAATPPAAPIAPAAKPPIRLGRSLDRPAPIGSGKSPLQGPGSRGAGGPRAILPGAGTQPFGG